MSGEISLRGLVLPVGGIKEKVVAAARAGIKRVILPARNRKDYEDIPEEARRDVEIIWIDHVEEAVAAAICSEEQKTAKTPREPEAAEEAAAQPRAGEAAE